MLYYQISRAPIMEKTGEEFTDLGQQNKSHQLPKTDTDLNWKLSCEKEEPSNGREGESKTKLSFEEVQAKYRLEGTPDEISYFYNKIFSPYEAMQGIRRRNETLEMNKFDKAKSDSEQQAIYLRRAKRVQIMERKQNEQLDTLYQMESENPTKFQALFRIFRVIHFLKGEHKLDYFSHKTFLALRGSSQKQLQKLLGSIFRIYNSSAQLLAQNFQPIGPQQLQKLLNKQFLLIFRFLISREKIQEMVREQDIQDNFVFMVGNLCLSPQNNQANKKFPDKKLIQLLETLLKQEEGRQIFKVICSLNHGNKFRLKYGGDEYEKLYSKQLNEIKELEKEMRKKVKKSNSTESKGKRINFAQDSDFKVKVEQISIEEKEQEQQKLKRQGYFHVKKQAPESESFSQFAPENYVSNLIQNRNPVAGQVKEEY